MLSVGKVLLKNLEFPNGIAFNPSKTVMYVAETLGKRIKAYVPVKCSVNSAGLFQEGCLKLIWESSLPHFPDNIDVDPRSGTLWIAGHNKVLSFFAMTT